MAQYVKTVYVNGEAPARNATNLNKQEQGIFDNSVHTWSTHAPIDAEKNALNTVIDDSYVHTDNNFTTVLKTNYDLAYAHISDTTKHFLQSEISIIESQISDLGSYEPSLGYTPEDSANKGASEGYAELVGGTVPTSQLPAYVDDVLEFADEASFPVTGESGKIYVALDTNLTYRWSGTIYIEISSSLTLGETSATAYRGDRGKLAYDHSQTTHAPTDSASLSAANTFTEPQRTTVEVGLNALSLTDMQTLSFTATLANISIASQTVGQAGTIRILLSENITGWPSELFWGTQGEPVGLTGTQVFSYEVFDANGISSIAIGIL